MILQLTCMPLLLLIKGAILLLPILTYVPNSIVSTLDLLLKAMQFFPNDVWFIVIGNIVFWITLHLAWSFVKFILGLIPFVGMGS